MARRFAQLNVSIWQDGDFRALPREAQHLYFVLWTHPLLDYAGVLDWRPGRLAALAGGWTLEQIQAAADCLEARLFVVVDPNTEEALVRAWFRFDGLMNHHKMCISFANAFSATASNDIRGVLVHELRKLRKIEPDLIAWTKPQVLSILDLDAIDPRDRDRPADPLTLGLTPGLTLGLTPGVTPPQPLTPRGANPRANPRATPAPAPAPKRHDTTSPDSDDDAPADAGAGRTAKTQRGTRIPSPFVITPEMVEWARKECPSLNHKTVTDAFVDYWTACPGARGVKLDWVATWRNWMRREATSGKTARPEGPTRGTGFWGRTA